MCVAFIHTASSGQLPLCLVDSPSWLKITTSAWFLLFKFSLSRLRPKKFLKCYAASKWWRVELMQIFLCIHPSIFYYANSQGVCWKHLAVRVRKSNVQFFGWKNLTSPQVHASFIDLNSISHPCWSVSANMSQHNDITTVLLQPWKQKKEAVMVLGQDTFPRCVSFILTSFLFFNFVSCLYFFFFKKLSHSKKLANTKLYRSWGHFNLTWSGSHIFQSTVSIMTNYIL